MISNPLTAGSGEDEPSGGVAQNDGVLPVVSDRNAQSVSSSISGVSRSVLRAGTQASADVQVSAFLRNLDGIVSKDKSPDELWSLTAALLRRHGAAFVGQYSGAGNRIGEAERLVGLTAPAEGLDQSIQTQLIQYSAAALGGGQQAVSPVNAGSLHAAVVSGQTKQVLVVIGDKDSGELPLLVGLAAARISEYLARAAAQSTSEATRHSAALVELVGHLSQCDDVCAAAGRLCRELERYLHAERVVVGYCDEEQADCRLIADSQQPSIDSNNDETRMILAMLEESIARRIPSVWPTTEATNRHALLAHARLSKQLGDATVLACPLAYGDGEPRGAIGVFVDSAHSDTEKCDDARRLHAVDSMPNQCALSFLTGSAEPIAATLGLLDRSAPGTWQHLRRALRGALTTQRWRTLLTVFAVCCTVLMVPMPYKINCDAELQPVSRRYVATPFDGTLKESLVRPGEYVKQNAVLALMDEREVQWELAGIQADRSRARKEQNSYLTDHNYREAEIARHEVERLQHRLDLLNFRSNNLELRSPIDGIVVSGDHQDEEGVPLETGETLFEIAPLDRMVIEVAVPEEDIRWVRDGMPVRLQLDAMPASVFRANVLRIHPRAELRDHQNVFLIEAEIDNRDGLLRPGMRGNAQIMADRHTLGWNLFHKPTAWLVGWLGW